MQLLRMVAATLIGLRPVAGQNRCFQAIVENLAAFYPARNATRVQQDITVKLGMAATTPSVAVAREGP